MFFSSKGVKDIRLSQGDENISFIIKFKISYSNEELYIS